MRLLTPEELARDGGRIPVGDYALKVYGFDEFLAPHALIGRHPFVGHQLSHGRDVELEVGRRQLPTMAAPSSRVRSIFEWALCFHIREGSIFSAQS